MANPHAGVGLVALRLCPETCTCQDEQKERGRRETLNVEFRSWFEQGDVDLLPRCSRLHQSPGRQNLPQRSHKWKIQNFKMGFYRKELPFSVSMGQQCSARPGWLCPGPCHQCRGDWGDIRVIPEMMRAERSVSRDNGLLLPRCSWHLSKHDTGGNVLKGPEVSIR